MSEETAQALPLDPIARSVQFLAGSPWLASTPPKFRTALLDRCKPHRFGKGDSLFSIGEPSRGVWGIAAGSVSLAVAPHEKGPTTIHSATAGFWLGEYEVLTGRRHFISAIADQPVLAFHASGQNIETLVAAEPGFWRWFGVLASEHMRQALGVIDDLTIRDSRRRLASLLLRLSGQRNAAGGTVATDQTEVVATQERLGEMANLSRAMVVRLLAEFESAGLVDRHYRQIRIRDEAGLTDILVSP